MKEYTKVEIIQQAIDIGADIVFDYVSSELSVKFGKQVTPKEVKGSYLYAMHNDQLKRYLLDGIQKVEVV